MPEGGNLEYTPSSAVHIWLPPAFPHEPPLVRPISALFHPNVAADGIKIPTIFVTAHDDDATRRRIEESGAVAHFWKPVDGQALLDAIRLAIGSGHLPRPA